MSESKKKDFDCIEMKRQSALWLHEQMEGMTAEEKAAFLAELSSKAMAHIAKLREEAHNQPKPAAR